MSVQSFLDRVAAEVDEERRLAKAADESAAIEGREKLEAFFEKCYPKFWAEAKGCITGCVVVRLSKPAGGSGDGALALVVDDRLLVYRYRNSAYDQITVDHYLQGEKLPKTRKTYCSKIYYYDEAPSLPHLENDRILADLIRQAIDENK